MNTLALIGAFVALVAYVPIIKNIQKSKESFSFASFLLWACLDAITAITIFLENGLWVLPAAFVLGSVIIAIMLYRLKQRVWGGFENFITVLVIICLIIWWYSGNTAGTIISVIAVFLAGFPQIKECWKNPDSRTVHIWALFTLGNILTFFAGEGWSYEDFIQDRLCAAVNGLGALILLVLSGRRIFSTT